MFAGAPTAWARTMQPVPRGYARPSQGLEPSVTPEEAVLEHDDDFAFLNTALQAHQRILGRAGNATRTLAEIATGIPAVVGHGHLPELIYGRPSQLP